MEQTDPKESTPTAFRLAFAAAAVASLIPLWSVRYVPMVDLPQHAAQIYLWQHFNDPGTNYGEIYDLRLLTPYLLGHSIARLFAVFFSVPVAMQAMLSVAVLALPLSLLYLARRVGCDPWPTLMAFPLTYGFAFHWGLTNYLIAVPAALLFIALGLDQARAPTRRGAWMLGLAAFALYFCHAFAFVMAMPIVGLLLIGLDPDLRREAFPRRAFLRVAPLMPAGIAIVGWILWMGASDPNTRMPNLWSETPWQRLLNLPVLWVGARLRGPWLWGGLAVLLTPLIGSRIAWRPWWRWTPLLVALGLFFGAPNRAMGTWFVYPRLAVFVGLFFLLPLIPAAGERRRRAGRAALLALVFVWMAFLTVKFRQADAEARHFDRLLARMDAGRSVLGLIFDPGIEMSAGVPVYGHFHMWYQAQKGGLAEYSFAIAYPQLVQYRPGAGPRSSPELSLRPDLFDFERDGRFDYFLVRADADFGPRLFRAAPRERPVRLLEHSGKWWLYSADSTRH